VSTFFGDNRRAVVALALSVVLAVASTGCSIIRPQATGKPRTANAVVLLDLSGSTRSSAVRAEYRSGLDKVAARLFYGDTLSVWSIDKDSIENSRPLNNDAPFPLLTFDKQPSTYERRRLSNDFKAQHALAQIRTASLAPVQAHLMDQTKGSDLLGAMAVASRKFELGNADDRWLIIFSDMLINDGRWKMGKGFNPQKMLVEVRKEEGIASLKGVNVVVVGANAASKKEWRTVEGFWLEYFKEAGANVPPAQYGAQMPSDLLNGLNSSVTDQNVDPTRVPATR
jgi:hypothetical protein